MRAFVAALPPPEAVEHLDAFLSSRREAAALSGRHYRWTDPSQWHLTLAFSSEVPDRALDDLEARLERAARKRRPVELSFAGGGAFPHPDRAKVLWSGLLASEDDRVELDRMATGARAALGKAGAQVDGQRFRAHLTLARLGHPDNVTSFVRVLDAYQGPTWTLDEVALVASYLGEGPRRRPRHEVIGTYPLA
ncbi:RNA 2',3'-cyclic phosphodiesterase [Nocardioides seonyuensis]|uniref:RNA 2',3'-cyclic phosphodiesterase n=1 Tax=Nocardioides seonyuensis TaxID=2518371 RepID=A0A4P7IFE0_9ACTN|nr:RNA 2',3'-cyclic phosphodiesterase [Nocardioides seonyuensis]QBX55293.1 RNA 2',3'-cyclic phosphodiesterase [Nocardioides seonyuensis]